MNLVNFLTEVGTYLQSNAVGTLGQTIFCGTMPSSPINCIGLFGTGGPRIGGDVLKKPNLQILIRNSNNQTGATQTTTVFNLLDDKWNILTTFDGRCLADHQPGPYYRDVNNNIIFTLNFNFILKED